MCKGPEIGGCPTVHGGGTMRRPVWREQDTPEKNGEGWCLRMNWGQVVLRSWFYSTNTENGGVV